MRREHEIEDVEAPDDETLIAYTEQFIGLGDPFAPFWFVWSGPAFPSVPYGIDMDPEGESASDWSRAERLRLLTMVDTWSRRRSAVLPFEELYGLRTGKYPYHAVVSALAEACRGGPAFFEDRHALEPDVFRAELFPLSPHGLEALGSPTILAPYMNSRRAYAAYRRIQRLQLLRSVIAEFNPTLVFMFGRSAESLWLEMPEPADSVRWRERGRIDWAAASGRLYVSAPAPNPFFIPPRERDAIARSVGALLSQMRRVQKRRNP
jgi:hypothetical protein